MAQTNYNQNHKATWFNDTSDGKKWGDFNEKSGNDVEQFIKHELEKSVIDFKYQQENQLLSGINAYGETVCETKIVNAEVTYTVDCSFINIKVGNNLYNGNDSRIQINKTDTLNVEALFKFVVTGNIAGSTYNETSSHNISFNWFNYVDSDYIIDNTLPAISKNITPNEQISINISQLFNYAFSNKYLGITYTPMGKNQSPITVIFKSSFTLKALVLAYSGEFLLTSNIISGLKLTGLDNSERASDYYYSYYLDGTEIHRNPKVTSTDNESLNLTLPNLEQGMHTLFIRVQDKEQEQESSLVSNDIQIDFIYQPNNATNMSGTALVTAVPNTIFNCDTSPLFTIVTTDRLQGDAHIIVLKSSNLGEIINISTIEEALKYPKLCFKEIQLSLTTADKTNKKIYKSYIEVNSTTTEFIRVLMKSGENTKICQFFYRNNTGVGCTNYKNLNIINPKNGVSHLIATPGAILNFSQISNGNVFENLNPLLDEADGLQIEEENDISLSTFKVSPTNKVFDNPKPLLNGANVSLNSGKFSIEMVIKTYNCNNLDDELLSIGNIKLCPKHLYIFRAGEDLNSIDPGTIKNSSRADFQKNKRQHILITFDPDYKPDTYINIYDQLYAEDNIKYSNTAKAYPCLKIYVNGVINRTIMINANDLGSDFNLQIHPNSSNINFYTFRTYEKALSYKEVKQNYISSLLSLSEKENFYEINDLLYEEEDFKIEELNSKKENNIIGTISLGKCINKFKSVGNPKQYKDRRVLLVALPENAKPPFYGNRKSESVATLLIHYPNDKEHSGILYPRDDSGKTGIIKAQGSSAKKYLIHNTSYSKFYFRSQEQIEQGDQQSVKYYIMPNDKQNIKIEKLVGKVNYASSMQSHKQGATKLFHEGYISDELNMDKTWMNGGRKAVLEDDFLYFYVNVPLKDLATITWDYFKQEDGSYNFENCYFLGFQTWGSAKGDKPTSGYDDNTPYYIMLEGADNSNPAANFKVPWAAMQCWKNVNSVETEFQQFSGKDNAGNPDYLSGILINDETIVYNPGAGQQNSSDKRPDAWDVDFGATEMEEYDEDINPVFEFEEKAKVSVKRFAEFYNLIYKFDFSSLVSLPKGPGQFDPTIEEQTINGITIKGYNKIVFNDGWVIGNDPINAGNIYRWEKNWSDDVKGNAPRQGRWVPAGLFYNDKLDKWDDLNIYDICNEYTQASQSFFSNNSYDTLRAQQGTGVYLYYGKKQEHTLYAYDNIVNQLLNILAEAFKIILHEYMDIDDITYHQAFIRLIAGTDNRAKNTYFQIVGPINPDDNYEITPENLRKDFKIRLYQDDLDTIFKTDNNGQQVKPYYLLEPPFNTNLSSLWGDLHSGFFYNLDIVCMEEIKAKLGALLKFAVGNNWPDQESTKIHEYFLKIQKDIPAVAYNHQSEIYYESAQTLWQKGETDFYKALRDSSNSNWKDFNNNKVAYPLSLSHGSCYDAEVEYLRDRILLLSSYAGEGKKSTDKYISFSAISSDSTNIFYELNTEYVSFIQYVYPTINGELMSKEVSSMEFDTILNKVYNKASIVYNIVVPNTENELSSSWSQDGLTTAPTWDSVDLYRTVKINKGSEKISDFLDFPNASTIICQDSDYQFSKGSEIIDAQKYIQSIEHLILQEATINTEGFNFQKCNRLKTLVLGETSNNKTDDEIPTENSKYYAIKIQDVINPSKEYSITLGKSCKGFNTLILPNSNILEQLVIPNCVKILNMGYYPNLYTFEINNGTKLENLVIDGRNDSKWIDYILNSYIAQNENTIIRIINIPEDGIWLSEDTCTLMASIKNFYFDGTINIGNEQDGLTGISFNSKKTLVERFGLDFEKFNYRVVEITKAPTVLKTSTMSSSGYANIGLVVKGNNVVVQNGKLQLTYSITKDKDAIGTVTINSNTGYMEISEDTSGKFNVTVSFYYGDKQFEGMTEITIGFYPPEVGYFAYGDGSFSKQFNPTLSLVGIVYYVEEVVTNQKYNIKVLSSESISDYGGPCLSLKNHASGLTTLDSIKKQQENFKSLLDTITGYDSEAYYKSYNTESISVTGTIEYGSKFPQISDNRNAQKEYYIELAQNYIDLLNYDCDLNNAKDFENAYEYLNTLTEYRYDADNKYTNNTGNYPIGNFSLGIFPAILKCLYFAPQGLSFRGEDYYKQGQWHACGINDISALLIYRIHSCAVNNQPNEDLWDNHPTEDNSSPFSREAFSRINFLMEEQLDNNHPVFNAIESEDDGTNYFYTETNWDSVKWYNSSSLNYYSTTHGCRDQVSYTLYPCCYITLEKKS